MKTDLENIPVNIKEKAMKHQLKGVSRFIKQENTILLGWQMGAGKSFGSLIINIAKKSKAIIIAPKSLLRKTWRKEILKWNLTEERKVFLYDNNIKLLDNSYDFYIFNYEKFRFLEKIDSNKPMSSLTKLTIKERGLYHWLLNIKHEDFITIYDETYKIKNYKSKLHKAFLIFRFNFNWKGILGLSGTPQENNIREFYTILNFIMPNTITWDQMEKYFIYRPPWNKYDIQYKNLQLFNEMANKVMYRVLKKDVIDDLPELNQEYREVSNSKVAKDLKKRLIQDEDSTIFSIYTTLRVIDSFLEPNPKGKKYDILKDYYIEHTEKYTELLNIIEEVGDDQILIFTAYSKTMNWLIKKLKTDFKNKSIIGVDSNTKNSDDIYEKFDGGEINIVVATDVWAKGVDFPQVDYLINWDLPVSPAIFAQRRDRIHRKGSKRPKLVISLISDIIENDIYKMIKNKIILSEQTVEGVSEKQILTILKEKWGMK